MDVGRPEAGREQSSLPTSPEENKMMSSTNYFKVTGMDLIYINEQRPQWNGKKGNYMLKN